MPERDIQQILGRMVVNQNFAKEVLGPQRKKAIALYPLTLQEREALEKIKADSLAEFAQEIINLGLAEGFVLPNKHRPYFEILVG